MRSSRETGAGVGAAVGKEAGRELDHAFPQVELVAAADDEALLVAVDDAVLLPVALPLGDSDRDVVASIVLLLEALAAADDVRDKLRDAVALALAV